MTPSLNWNFDNSYSKLPSTFFSPTLPTKFNKPSLVYFNLELAKALDLTTEEIDNQVVESVLSGDSIPDGALPIAQAYAGHQFGHFTKLGDGRAILLGEHLTSKSERFDIQLKGAGLTAYSRRGDGLATLRAMLREYLISEAMFYLNIPTSRSLAVVKTGEKVYREMAHEGAVLTRVMQSHIRVGTFEYVSSFLSLDELKIFLEYVVQRHYPTLSNSNQIAIDFLNAVVDKQVSLITHWMRVGFIHGVMNTDNMSIAGETFDYGPCAFLNVFHPRTVFSSIDTQGRYAYGNQPRIAQWNLSVLAGALLPLIDENQEIAIEKAQEILDTFPEKYTLAWQQMMANKLGFKESNEEINAFAEELLPWMQLNQADFTNTFLVLQKDLLSQTTIYQSSDFINLENKWKALLEKNNISFETALQLMRINNPAYIPRNYLVEEALNKACENNDYQLFDKLLAALKNPYQFKDEFQFLQEVPLNADAGYRTFCGT